MKTITLPLIGLCLAACIPVASAADGNAPYPYFVSNCYNCHGTEGRINSAIPSIAGRDREFLEITLKAFKAGTKPATIMHQLAKGYTDQEIAILADYFSRQK